MIPGRIYLAARYSRRLELCGYREHLRTLGGRVEARWLDGKHQLDHTGKPLGDHGELLVEGSDEENTAPLRVKFAQDDVHDVIGCSLFIAFTEPPDTTARRGGRMVELGMALGLDKRVMVVGYRENLFCWLPEIEFYKTWDEARKMI